MDSIARENTVSVKVGKHEQIAKYTYHNCCAIDLSEVCSYPCLLAVLLQKTNPFERDISTTSGIFKSWSALVILVTM